MSRILTAFLLAGLLRAQTPAPEAKDVLGRTTPQSAIVQFLEACHARDYAKATLFLDLRKMPAAQRAKARRAPRRAVKIPFMPVATHAARPEIRSGPVFEFGKDGGAG